MNHAPNNPYVNQIRLEIVKFWTRYRDIRDPATGEATTIGEDWVEYCKPGASAKATTKSQVAKLKQFRFVGQSSKDHTAQMAQARWLAIEPHYTAWRNGQELPEDGTPLAAWSHMNEHQITALAGAGIRTMEQLADALDSQLDMVALPNRHLLRKTAKDWLENRNVEVARQENEKAQAKIRVLEEAVSERNAALSEMLERLEALEAKSSDERKKPGRKPLPRDENGEIIRDEAAA